MAGTPTPEQNGSDKSGGVLLIAYHLASGSAYCMQDGALLTMPLNADGQLQIDHTTSPASLDWGECIQGGEEEDQEHLRPVIEALGHSFEEVYSKLPFR
ncbi:hypothetical protein [Hymenobacter sp. DG01]|uniref:hypothetical protein n=1 Tax=Hymenobacter sp. DG01 TaxID=2584940 RepID=UPI0011210BB6|nr:hypothetical protein [Hymenobacter sp. DG01]